MLGAALGRTETLPSSCLSTLDAAARQGYDVFFTTQSQLLASLCSAAVVGNYDRRFRYLAKLPLLIIDDFGLKPLRSPDDEVSMI